MSELFGLAHYATNAAFVNTTFIASSFGIAATLTNWSYQHGKSKPHERACIGKQCFGLAFVVCAIIGLITTAASIVLTLRRRKFYKRMYRCAASDVHQCRVQHQTCCYAAIAGTSAQIVQVQWRHGCPLVRSQAASEKPTLQVSALQAQHPHPLGPDNSVVFHGAD